ncbi:hypothetical protein AB0B25_31505 [Nocardia sp. NPDC049190]|uniref:hypothetical protein n=1 Tax=Nocardia sp. NPDC049190 TaxID=3155650 RepID=UPI0033E3D63C
MADTVRAKIIDEIRELLDRRRQIVRDVHRPVVAAETADSQHTVGLGEHPAGFHDQ